tara:strand:- start:901 stop:1359 length:459 start_codon:yes stop_codon:yes gene_type:complete
MSKIKDVIVVKKNIIPDERGSIMHMLKTTDSEFIKFGEVYFSTAYPNVIKGWHLHTRQTQNYVVVEGMIKLVLLDKRKKSKTYGLLEEHYLGDLNYSLCQIPPGVANGYKVIGNKKAIICNCSDLIHEPDEMLRYLPSDKSFSDYSWQIVYK